MGQIPFAANQSDWRQQQSQLMHNKLEQVLSQNQSQHLERDFIKTPKYHDKYFELESTEGKDLHQQEIIPSSVLHENIYQQDEKPYQLRLPAAKKEEIQAQRSTTRQGKRSKILIDKVDQNNDNEIPLRQKPNNVLKLYDLQNQEEQVIQEVLVVTTTEIQSATRINTIPIGITPPNEQPIRKKHRHQLPQGNQFLVQGSKETVHKETQIFQKRPLPQVKVNARYNEQDKNDRKQDPQLINRRSRLLDVAKAKQANMKKGLFFQQKNNDQDYVIQPQFNSRSQLDTGLQIMSSREQFSSREILDSKTFVNQEKGSRKRLPALQPLNKLINNNQKKLYEIITAQRQVEVPQMQKNLVLLKNGKYAIQNEDIQDIYRFIRQPIPYDRTLESTIVRNKTCQKLWYLDYDIITNEGRYLLSSKKMPFHLGSTYNISLLQNQFQPQSEYFIGKIQANFLGSIFNIYTPKAQNNKDLELSATIYYNPDFTCCRLSAREIQVYIKNHSYLYQQLEGSSQKEKNLKQLYLIPENQERRKIKKFVNKKPVWRQFLQAFVLNFRGKSKIASVKNMILVNADNERQEGLLFAKKDTNQFFLDISYPFSPLIGFGVAMSSFDFKLASQ